jgi:hypothetical protein
MSYFLLIANGQFELCYLSWEQVVYVYLSRNDTEINVISQHRKREKYDKKGSD